MSAIEADVQSVQYVDFWNDILVPKFIKYKHILVDGLTHHSEAIFPSLPVKEGDRVLDIGCGFWRYRYKAGTTSGPEWFSRRTGLLRGVPGVWPKGRHKSGLAECFVRQW